MLNKIKIEDHSKPITFAFINKVESIREESSSGGIFDCLANYVLNKGGIVFGVGFNDKWEVIHQSVEDIGLLKNLRGSKYVQSNVGYEYEKVKIALDKKRVVLFSGTPCQIVGLKSYLKKDFENLLTVDIICHGVPSPLVWKKYVEMKGYSEKIEKISFRSKYYGWKKFSMLFGYNSQTEITSLDKDLFMQGFLSNLYLRPSCYKCNFKTKKRNSDFTIADFWGIDNILPAIDDDKGISLVFLHSEKAKNIFYQLPYSIKKQVKFEDAVKYNPSMMYSSPPNKNKKFFFKELIEEKISIDKLINKYTRISLKTKIYNKLYGLIRKILTLNCNDKLK